MLPTIYKYTIYHQCHNVYIDAKKHQQEGKKPQRPSFPPMDWTFDGNEYDPMIPNDYERVVRGKHNSQNILINLINFKYINDQI